MGEERLKCDCYVEKTSLGHAINDVFYNKSVKNNNNGSCDVKGNLYLFS